MPGGTCCAVTDGPGWIHEVCIPSCSCYNSDADSSKRYRHGLDLCAIEVATYAKHCLVDFIEILNHLIVFKNCA